MKRLSIPKGTWTLIRFRPGFFLVSVLGGALFMVTELVPGQVEKRYFDVLTGAATLPWGLTLETLLLLYVLLEIGRSFLDTAAHWGEAHVRNAAGSLLRANLLHSLLQKPGAAPLPVPAGDAVNRFNADAADFADFPTWISYLFGRGLFTFLAFLIMFRIAPLITLVAVLPFVGVLLLNRYVFQKLLLITVIGIALTVAGLRRRSTPEIYLLGAGSAVGLLAIDLVYTRLGRIPRVYLLDAAVELVLLAGWLLSFLRGEIGDDKQEYAF